MNLSTGTMFKNLNTSGEDFIHLKGELLRRVQLTLASMMDDVAYVCDKSGITWLLSGGSVLGAIRHGGFIPWDDDMDIFLCGKDRRKFYRAMRKEFGDRYAIQTERTPGYGLTVSRVSGLKMFLTTRRCVPYTAFAVLRRAFCFPAGHFSKTVRP